MTRTLPGLVALVACATLGCSDPGGVSPKNVIAEMGSDVGTADAPDLGSPVISVVVEPSNLAIERGRTATLVAQVLADGREVAEAVTWSSSEPGIVEVTPTGVVIGHEFGRAVVSAAVGDVRGEATVRVTGPPVDRIEVSPTSRQMAVGSTVTINVVLIDAQNATIEDPRDVSFASSDEARVTVTADGLVTAVSEGGATVTTRVEAASAVSEFVVIGEAGIDRVEISPVTSQLLRGETAQLIATAYTGGATVPGAVFVWDSDASAVATVDGTGLVTAVTQGSATITAASGAIEAGATVNVQFAFSEIAAGHDFACGLVGGAAYCWGRNDVGQLGRADTSEAPGAVATSLRFDALAAGAQRACGLTAAGAAYCWGAGNSAPTLVGGGHVFSALYAGYQLVCGVEGASLWCWDPASSPTLAGSFQSAAVGQTHRCAVSGTSASCWGSNDFGQLGINAFGGSYPAPQPVSGGFQFSRVVVGRDHSCGTTTSGASLCWGANEAGQVGDGSTTDRPTPLLLSGGASVGRLTVGIDHSCGLASDGAAYCWGRNDAGLLGTGANGAVLVPVAVATSVRFSQISAGDRFTCALSLDGDPYCWGLGDRGQLGVGGSSAMPTRVLGL